MLPAYRISLYAISYLYDTFPVRPPATHTATTPSTRQQHTVSLTARETHTRQPAVPNLHQSPQIHILQSCVLHISASPVPISPHHRLRLDGTGAFIHARPGWRQTAGHLAGSGIPRPPPRVECHPRCVGIPTSSSHPQPVCRRRAAPARPGRRCRSGGG